MPQVTTGRPPRPDGHARAAEPAGLETPALLGTYAPVGDVDPLGSAGRRARHARPATGANGRQRTGPAPDSDGGVSARRTEVWGRAGAAPANAPAAPKRTFARALPVLAAVGLGLAALAGPAAAQAAPPQPGPFQACMGEKLTGRSLDDFSVRDAARACRDVTDEAGRAGLRQAGLDPATLEACAEKPLTDAEILRLRGASGPYFMMLTTFVWQVENIFPNRVLRSIEVRHYTPTMNEVGFSTRSLIGPGGKGTFVLFDLGEMIPQLKHTLKIARMTYCELP